MKAADVAHAVKTTPGEDTLLNTALAQSLPVLDTLVEMSSGWKFWLRWGMRALVGVLRAYLQGKGWRA